MVNDKQAHKNFP